MLNFIEWLALPNSNVVVRPAQGGRGVFYLGSRHARRFSIGVDYLGVPCVALSINDRQMFSTATWEKVIFAINSSIPAQPEIVGSTDQELVVADFIGLVGKESRNGGRFTLFMPASSGLLQAVEEAGARAGSITNGSGRIRIGIFYVENGSADKPQWLQGDDFCDVPLVITRDQVLNGDLAWQSNAQPPSAQGKPYAKQKKFNKKRR